MVTYREDGRPVYREDGRPVYVDDGRPVEPVVVRRRRGGGFIVGLILILALIVALLFYTGFWTADVTQPGALPKISINTTPGVMPKVDLESKKIVISSKKEEVAVPTMKVKDSKSDDN
jgi:hypothetical protein